MNSENLNKLSKLSQRIIEKTVDIQQEISQPSSYVDPNHQRLKKKAFAIQREWRQLITINFIYAAFALVIGLCILRLIGKLGIFVAVPLTLPATIHFGLEGLRLLLQGDPLDEFPTFHTKRRN